MIIQSGKLYENRTWRYLYPSLKFWGPDLESRLNGFYKLAVGIGDANKEIEEQAIFILIDVNVTLQGVHSGIYREQFVNFLNWVKFQPFYIEDYVFDSNMEKPKHMVVVKMPPIFTQAFDQFKEGKYSTMYLKKHINEYFAINTNDGKESTRVRNERVSRTRGVLNQTEERRKEFVDIVNRDFNTNISVQDYKDAELDYPINLEEEIFNFLY